MAKEGTLGLEIMTELRLGLPGTTYNCPPSTEKSDKKRVFSEIANDHEITMGDRKNQKKTPQVVGWPPVCSYRKKNINHNVQSGGKNGSSDHDSSSAAPKLCVKVSMDGAPYLRKIDLNVHKGYSDLVVAFEKLFGCSGRICKDSDGLDEYIPIYADKEGDWMLVGDVPWRMFTESCKRLRIMKRSDAKDFGFQSWNNSSNLEK
ncbi:AUX/IAA protein [Macleaya cordata]|uniref:Auxin-responsive protein n=1 Tax=Macleaya cordata TaxID=56857 RepID=A0A200PNB5_MACCD|nr:AUX/IAA protein [Macleaya cordata]